MHIENGKLSTWHKLSKDRRWRLSLDALNDFFLLIHKFNSYLYLTFIIYIVYKKKYQNYFISQKKELLIFDLIFFFSLSIPKLLLQLNSK